MKKKLSVVCFLALLAACTPSPDPRIYSLAVQPGLVAPQPSFVVKIQRPILAGYLDRPAFISQDGAYRLLVDENHQWGEPLDTMITRILAADIQQRLPSSSIVTEDDNTPPHTRFTVTLHLQRFNATDDGNVLVQGQLLIEDSHADDQLPPLPIQGISDNGDGPSDIVEGLSQLLGAVADQSVATMILLDQPPSPMSHP